MAEDLTLEVLKQIRDELREVRDETRANGVKLDQVRTELGSRLDRVVHEQIRHATAIVELEAGQRVIVAELKSNGAELVKMNARFDNVITGSIAATVRDTVARVDKLEEQMGAVGAKQIG